MSKVYVVSSEGYDHVDGRLVGAGVEGVFDSEEKAVEDIKKNYGTDYCNYWEGNPWKTYEYDTDECVARVTVVEHEVNKSVWEDLA